MSDKSVPASDAAVPAIKKTRAEMQALTAKQYIDQTVAPILLQAMQLLVKERPPDPIGFMAAHLLKNRPKSVDGSQETVPTTDGGAAP